jgi:hypothetical protein
MEKKREGDREAAGEGFLASDPLYHWFFGIGDGKGELLKLLLAGRPSSLVSAIPFHGRRAAVLNGHASPGAEPEIHHRGAKP